MREITTSQERERELRVLLTMCDVVKRVGPVTERMRTIRVHRVILLYPDLASVND